MVGFKERERNREMRQDTRERERERKEIFEIISGSDFESRVDLSYLLGKPLHCTEGERKKEGPSFVFAETSWLGRHFACYLKSTQGKMPSPSQRGRPDAGPHVLVPGSPSKSPLETKGAKDLPRPSRQSPEAQNRFVTR